MNTAGKSSPRRNTGRTSWTGKPGSLQAEIEENRRRAEEQSRKNRWEFKGKARVVHPKYGEVIVPAPSPFAAMLCAAEVWGIDWLEIKDAKVWRYEENDHQREGTGQSAASGL